MAEFVNGCTVNGEGGNINSPFAYDPEFRGATALDERVTPRAENSPTRGPSSGVTLKQKRPRKTPVYSLTKIRRRAMYGY